MTLVIGLVAADHIVLASDSQMTGDSTKHLGQKVWAGSSGYVFGLAGAEATMDEYQRTILASDHVYAAPPSGLTEVQLLATDVLSRVYGKVVAVVPTVGFPNLPIAVALLGTYTNDVPGLFEAGFNGIVTDRAGVGFCAVGTGSPFAEHAFTAYRAIPIAKLSLHQARMLAFRIVEDAVAIAGPSILIGGEVQLASVSRTGETALLTDADRRFLADLVQEWRQNEAERLLEQEPPPGAVVS